MINDNHILHINLTIDFIRDNIGDKIRLDNLADKGMYSKHHLSRLFKSVTKENIIEYIKRVRMEQACRIMRLNPDFPINEISILLGYQSAANFCRDFQQFHGSSPKTIRKQLIQPKTTGQNQDGNFQLECLGTEHAGEQYVIYKKIINGYEPGAIRSAFVDLHRLAGRKKITVHEMVGIGYNDPEYTPADKCTYDTCLIVDKPAGQIAHLHCNHKILKGGKYVVFRFNGHSDQLHAAWQQALHFTQHESDHQVEIRPHMEYYPRMKGKKSDKLEVLLYLPVKIDAIKSHYNRPG